MTREAFIAAYRDELVGLILRPYEDTLPRFSVEADAVMGRRMLSQIQKAQQLLGRMWDQLNPTPPAPVNGKPAQPART